MRVLDALGRRLATYLDRDCLPPARLGACRPGELAAALRLGDVVLVDGCSRIAAGIKFLTQSCWSHAALCSAEGEQPLLIEADLRAGVHELPLSTYAGQHLRICRPRGLAPAQRQAVVAFARARLGHRYDLKNILDLARYLLPQPPVPQRWRRRMIRLGSGDPTRAICSTLIAQAFQSVRYPILPQVERQREHGPAAGVEREIFHIRHHSLFVPADFDLSPYFDVIKPRIRGDFDPAALVWADAAGRA